MWCLWGLASFTRHVFKVHPGNSNMLSGLHSFVWPSMIPLYVWFLMQKNILRECGLRRITFLIAQEVSPMLSASEFFTFFKTSCHLFEVCSIDWGGKDQWQEERWLSKWFVLAVDWVMAKNRKTSLEIFKWVLLDLVVFHMSFFCRKNFPSFSHSEQEMRYGEEQWSGPLFPGTFDIQEEYCPQSLWSLYSRNATEVQTPAFL